MIFTLFVSKEHTQATWRQCFIFYETTDNCTSCNFRKLHCCAFRVIFLFPRKLYFWNPKIIFVKFFFRILVVLSEFNILKKIWLRRTKSVELKWFDVCVDVWRWISVKEKIKDFLFTLRMTPKLYFWRFYPDVGIWSVFLVIWSWDWREQ